MFESRPLTNIQEEEESEGGTEGERRAFDAKPLLEGWGQLCLGQVGDSPNGMVM